MFKILLASVGLVASLVSIDSNATTGSWAKSIQMGVAILHDDPVVKWISPLFADFPGGASATYHVTGVAYHWTPYTNGNTHEKVEICYTPWFDASSWLNCTDISGAQTGTTPAFNSIEYRNGVGFLLRHTLTGGTYPTTLPPGQDTITVNFTY
ncbi:MAG TPA: hypothetical protein VGN04_06155 [Herbaspirillum sp.]|jgi:hypothetical protein